MEMNQLTQQADKLIRRVVNKYNSLYSPSGEISQIELDLLLDDLRHLYDNFKNISYLNSSLSEKISVPMPQSEPARTQEAAKASQSVAQNTRNAAFQFSPAASVVNETIQESKNVVYTLPPDAETIDLNSTEESTLQEQTVENFNQVIETTIVNDMTAGASLSEKITTLVSALEEEQSVVATSDDANSAKMHTIADTFKAPEKSLSDSLTETKSSVLGSRVILQPISDLASAIGLNDKFTFISELFNNNPPAYDEAVMRINRAVNYDEGMWILKSYNNSSWEVNQETANRFKDFIKRRFI